MDAQWPCHVQGPFLLLIQILIHGETNGVVQLTAAYAIIALRRGPYYTAINQILENPSFSKPLALS